MNVTDQGVPADELIAVIKEAITRAGVSAGAGARGLRVTSAQLTLQAVATTTAGGGLSFCVPFLGLRLDLGARITDQSTHTIDMTLIPDSRAIQPRAEAADEVGDVLVSAITTIRDTMAAADGGADPWALSTAVVDICFGVTKSGTISLGIDGGLQREAANTLRLSLRTG